MLKFLANQGTYEIRKLARDEVNGLEVSTAWTEDQGYETAIIDFHGPHPVQRYKNREAALVGHAEWLKRAETIKVVLELGLRELGLKAQQTYLHRRPY